MRSADASRRTSNLRDGQSEMFPVRIGTIFPEYPIGKDLAFVCQGHDGHTYYAKSDKDGRSIRATEWICTNLASQLGLSVAESVVLEDNDGETFFGSRRPCSLADDFRCEHYVRTCGATDELGRPSGWLGQYLAKLWAFDHFVDNPDRILRNFLLEGSGRLCAIDFASARFVQAPDTKFPIASESTTIVGKFIRSIHGAHKDSAFELLDWVGAIAPSTVEGIVRAMPEGWLTEDQMGAVIEVWSNGQTKQRVTSVKALIQHDWDV